MRKNLIARFCAIILMFGIMGLWLLPISTVGAQTPTPEDPLKAACEAGNTQDSSICANRTASATGNPITDTIIKASRLIGIVTGVAAVVVIIVSGIRYTTSGGDSASVNGAKNAILYAIVGLVVSATAPIIIQFILTRV